MNVVSQHLHVLEWSRGSGIALEQMVPCGDTEMYNLWYDSRMGYTKE